MSVRPHSPGPFVISQLRDAAHIEDSDGEIVAELFGGDGRDGMASVELLPGNAALLASSWDLLRAVRAAAEWLDDRAMLTRLQRAAQGRCDFQAERQSVLRQLHIAITKAEGRDAAMVNAVDSRVLTQDELRAENDELVRLADELGLGDDESDRA